MARKTRAAARAGENETPEETTMIQDQNENTTPQKSPDKTIPQFVLTVTPHAHRQPLQEVTANFGEQEAELEDETVEVVTPTKETKKKSRKRGGKKARGKSNKENQSGNHAGPEEPDVAEEQDATPVSPASDTAIIPLKNETKENIVIHEDEPEMSNVAEKQIEAGQVEDLAAVDDSTRLRPTTPINAEVAGPSSAKSSPSKSPIKDQSGAVSKLASLFEQPSKANSQETLVSEMITRVSSSKPASRSQSTSPTKQQDLTNGQSVDDPVVEVSKAMTTSPPAIKEPTKPRAATKLAVVSKKPIAVQPKPTVPRKASPTVAKSPVKASANVNTPRTKPIASAVPPTTKQRSAITALHTPPPAAKSAKAVTKPTFQLPGEVITAKLKAQREERQKRQEEEAAKEAAMKKGTRSRPISLTRPVEVRGTVTSRARMNSIGAGTIPASARKVDEKSATTRPIKRLSMIPSPTSTTRAPRVSTLASRPKPVSESPLKAVRTMSTIAKRPRPSSVVVTTSTTLNKNTANTARPRAPSMLSAAGKAPVTATETAQQRQRGKAVFNRSKAEKEEQDKLANEKREAAKKARAEAAEKGRQASREWAEKAKKAQVAKSIDGASSVEIATAV